MEWGDRQPSWKIQIGVIGVGNMKIWEYENMGIWEYEEYENMGIWEYENMRMHIPGYEDEDVKMYG
jgi:hypothetical protein